MSSCPALNTLLMNDQRLLGEAALYTNYDQEVTLTENQNPEWNINMKLLV